MQVRAPAQPHALLERAHVTFRGTPHASRVVPGYTIKQTDTIRLLVRSRTHVQRERLAPARSDAHDVREMASNRGAQIGIDEGCKLRERWAREAVIAPQVAA